MIKKIKANTIWTELGSPILTVINILICLTGFISYKKKEIEVKSVKRIVNIRKN